MSPGISTAELGIFEDGGILERACVEATAADGIPEEGAGPFEGGGADVLRPEGPLADPLLLGL